LINRLIGLPGLLIPMSRKPNSVEIDDFVIERLHEGGVIALLDAHQDLQGINFRGSGPYRAVTAVVIVISTK
jgi:hypothetical protein